MDSTIRQLSGSACIVIGPQGATNFAIIKARDGSAALIDADIRRIDEVEEASGRVRQRPGNHSYSSGKSRMVERNINHFLTGRWF